MKDAYWQMGWHAWVDGKTSCPFGPGHARDSWWRGYDDASSALRREWQERIEGALVVDVDDAVERVIPPGWYWTVYGPSGDRAARAVLVSHDYRTHIGRDGATGQAALRTAAQAARSGEKE